MKYARAELGPPKLSEFRIAKESFKNILYSARSGAWKDLKTRVSISVNCNNVLII